MPHTSVANSGKGSCLGWGINPFSTASRDNANKILDSKYMLIWERWNEQVNLKCTVSFIIMKSEQRLQAAHTWLLMLLLSPNTNHPPRQAARKEWDCKLFPWTRSCRACSPLYVNTKYARLREWVYVAFKMARSLSFKLSEERKVCSDSRGLREYLRKLNHSYPYLPLLNRNVITRACGALILAPYLRKIKHTLKCHCR